MKQLELITRVLEHAQAYIYNSPPSPEIIQHCLASSASQLTLDKDALLLSRGALTLTIDFNQGDYQHRRRFGGGRKQQLARALGLHKHPSRNIIDATAGLGKDSFVLASLGASVRMLERSPVLVLLLAHALARTSSSAIAAISQHMQLYWGDALELLPLLEPADAIYLDPMYPETEGAALPKKGAQMLRALAYRDEHEEERVLERARQHSPKVVVKRPKGAPFLANTSSEQQLLGKNTRYDVYRNSHLVDVPNT